MVKKLLESLKTKPKIDFCFFTGDLVYGGQKVKDFQDAKALLIDSIATELAIPFSNFIFCAGNHDIDREECSKAVITYFDKEVNTNDQLNSEYLSAGKDLTVSLKPTQNFYTFSKQFLAPGDVSNEFYSIHKRNVENTSIAIITINSAWLSSGLRVDLNNLMFPITALKQALNEVTNVPNKILLLRHPLSNFREFNGIELEDLIHSQFSLMFSGHIHRQQISTRYAGNNGIYANTTEATLTFDKEAQLGYSIIDYNSNDEEIKVDRSFYVQKESLFQDLTTVIVQIPCGIEKANQNKLRKKIISKFRIELNNANELMLDYSEVSGSNFLDTFTTPVLSIKSETESTSSESKGSFNYDTLYINSKNYLLFGKDKSGKTSLLKKVQLHYLKNFSLLGTVPFFLDYKELESKTSPIDILKLIRNYYEITTQETEKIIQSNNLVFLIDNLNIHSPVNRFVIEFLSEHKNLKFIVCSDYLASKIYFEELDHLDYEKVYFKDLSRKEIRLFAKKRPEIKSSQQEEVLEKISKVCKQLQLPINYWTVSLILLIYKRSSDDYNKNLFGILDLCVDEILQKKQLTLTKSKLTFGQYKEICSEIAHYLLIKYKEEVYSTSYTNLIQFIEQLIKVNPRLVADPKEILDYLLVTGLLKDKSGKITFRLNGLFEYFLAFYIYHHPDFKNEILVNNSIYLSFKNELEIYSGFNRQDEEFLRNIFKKTKEVFDSLIDNYKKYGNLDDVLLMKIGEANDFAERIRKLKIVKAYDHDTQDQILDSTDPIHTQSEVSIKKLVDASQINSEVLEKYLIILSRVFRNSDNIKNVELIYEIFDYLIEAYCSFGFFLIDWVSGVTKEENLEGHDIDESLVGEQMIKVITSFVPVLTQVLLFDGIGHISMKKIITDKIENYLKAKDTNQYKLFLLYFLLTDLDLKNNKNVIDEVFKHITSSPVLKVSTFFKLTFYLGFKSTDDKNLEKLLKIKVTEAQRRLDSKFDVDKMNRFLSRKQKRNIIKSHTNK